MTARSTDKQSEVNTMQPDKEKAAPAATGNGPKGTVDMHKIDNALRREAQALSDPEEFWRRFSAVRVWRGANE